MFDVKRLLGMGEGRQIDVIRKQGITVEKGFCKETYTVIKYKNFDLAIKNKPYDVMSNVCERGINCLLNAGITLMLNLLIGGSSTHYDTPEIGVGNSSSAASPSQSDLQGASKDWHSMEATFPSVSNQTVTFQGQFGDGHAEWNWLECAVKQATGTTTLLNRVVSDKGTKVSGEIWSAKLQITIS